MSGYENLPLAIGLWVFAGLWLVGAAVVPSLMRRHDERILTEAGVGLGGDHPDSDERKRRARVMAELREKWRDEQSPNFVVPMPWDDPPVDWLNRELAKRGELWTVPED